MTVQLMEAAVVFMMASIVQTSAGFGVGVVAVPLLLWLGWDLPVAIPAVLGAALGQGAFGLWKTRGHIALKESVFVAFFQCLGMPLGLLTMRVLLWEHPLLTRQAAGGLVLLLVVTSQFFRPEKVAKLRASAGALAGGGGRIPFRAHRHGRAAARFLRDGTRLARIQVPLVSLDTAHPGRAGAHRVVGVQRRRRGVAGARHRHRMHANNLIGQPHRLSNHPKLEKSTIGSRHKFASPVDRNDGCRPSISLPLSNGTTWPDRDG